MAVVLVEGFDHFSKNDASEKGWNGAIFAMVAGRGFGGQAIEVIANNPVWKTMPVGYSTIIVEVALWLRSGSLGTNPHGTLLQLRHAGSNVGLVGINASQRLYIQDNAANVTTGTTFVPYNTWFQVGFKVVVGTSGSGELQLNGGPEIASTVGNYGTSNVDQVLFNEPSTLSDMYVDDLVVLDTTGGSPQDDFLGDVRVETLYPAADGSYTDWTPKVGTDHFAMVNEHLIDGDGSYVYDASPGDKDSYIIETFIGLIYAAQLNIGARKGDASLRQIAPLIRQASTDYEGDTETLTSDYVIYTWTLSKDPTGADWLAATINADEFGQELIT